MSAAGADIDADVVIVGGGPAGLTAAAELARGLRVLVLEREAAAGGIPRHSDHPGYGMRDMRRILSGPVYARRLVEKACAAGALIETNSMVTGWSDGHTLEVTSPRGRHTVAARAVVLATGARERPRSARLIPGDRCSGIYTTGQLQNLVYLHHRRVGTRAVVVGGELVSWSAVLTLRHAGAHTALLTTTHRSPESYAAFNLAGRIVLGVEVATRTRIARIIGRPALDAVEIEHLDTGQRRIVDCDTLVLTGDWIPDHELARTGGLTMDPKTLGPLVDSAGRSSAAGVFAIGNMTHPVDTADIAALDGRAVAGPVREFLEGRERRPEGVRLLVDPPLRWVTPGLLRSGDPAPVRHRLLCWTDTSIQLPTVTVRQDGAVIARKRLPWPASAGRVFRVPAGLLGRADLSGGPVTISVQ